MTTVSIELKQVSELAEALKAAKTLKAKRVRVRGEGTWMILHTSEPIFRVDCITRPLRGGKRVLAKVDGKELVIEPDTYSKDAYIILKLTF